jgi:Ankyrin repeat
MPHVNTGELLAAVVAGDAGRVRMMFGDDDAAAEHCSLELPNCMTPLMAAATCGNETVVETLLQCGADPARRDTAGRTAAAYARAAGHPHLAARLDTVVDQERTMW